MSLAPGSASDVQQDLARGLKAISDRQDDYRSREDYYQGTVGEVITHHRLARLLDRYKDAFKLNYASVPADALMDRIDLKALGTGDKGIDALLMDRLWNPNSLDDDADDIHLHAAYLGDYYVVAEYIDPESDDATVDGEGETGTGVGTVELTPKHPSSTVIVYQRSNSRIPDFAVQMIQGATKGAWEALVYYDDETWTFTATEGGEGFDASKYTVDANDDGEADVVPNEFGFPVFHFRPDRKPYGLPVNAKMYGPQDAITKINATQMASMDYYGFPQRYRLLDPKAEQDDDIDDDFNDDGLYDGDDRDDAHPTGSSRLSSDPGGLWELPGGGSVGQFSPADPKGFLDPLVFQIRAGATLTRTPLYEFDLDGSGEQPSGEARRRADGPITKHAAKIKGQFGQVWSQIGAYTLAALGVGEGKRVEAVWAPSETATDNEGVDLIAKKIENGVPPRQALIEAGYTQDQVDDWMPISDDGMATPLTPKLIAALSASLRDLGTAKQLGTVSDEQIGRIFRTYFGDQPGTEPLPPGRPPNQFGD